MARSERYEWGPDATVRATRAASGELAGARAVVLVEGVSDQIAVDAAATVLQADLSDVVVMPIGGAHAIARALGDLDGHLAPDAPVAVLCDEGEIPVVDRALDGSERSGIARFTCCNDLEDELIRAVPGGRLRRIVDDEGDTAPFARMSAQPAWRDASFDARFRRFVGAGAGRKHRYAAAIVAGLGPRELPGPLVGVVRHVTE